MTKIDNRSCADSGGIYIDAFTAPEIGDIVTFADATLVDDLSKADRFGNGDGCVTIDDVAGRFADKPQRFSERVFGLYRLRADTVGSALAAQDRRAETESRVDLVESIANYAVAGATSDDLMSAALFKGPMLNIPANTVSMITFGLIDTVSYADWTEVFVERAEVVRDDREKYVRNYFDDVRSAGLLVLPENKKINDLIPIELCQALIDAPLGDITAVGNALLDIADYFMDNGNILAAELIYDQLIENLSLPGMVNVAQMAQEKKNLIVGEYDPNVFDDFLPAMPWNYSDLSAYEKRYLLEEWIYCGTSVAMSTVTLIAAIRGVAKLKSWATSLPIGGYLSKILSIKRYAPRLNAVGEFIHGHVVAPVAKVTGTVASSVIEAGRAVGSIVTTAAEGDGLSGGIARGLALTGEVAKDATIGLYRTAKFVGRGRYLFGGVILARSPVSTLSGYGDVDLITSDDQIKREEMFDYELDWQINSVMNEISMSELPNKAQTLFIYKLERSTWEGGRRAVKRCEMGRPDPGFPCVLPRRKSDGSLRNISQIDDTIAEDPLLSHLSFGNVEDLGDPHPIVSTTPQVGADNIFERMVNGGAVTWSFFDDNDPFSWGSQIAVGQGALSALAGEENDYSVYQVETASGDIYAIIVSAAYDDHLRMVVGDDYLTGAFSTI